MSAVASERRRKAQPPSQNAGAARAEQALADILGMFEREELPAAIAQTMIARQESDAPSNDWSLGNQLLMLLAGTTDARGFRQWQNVGRSVTKGARAFTILAPLKHTRTEHNTETGAEEKRTYISGFKGIPVFRYEDTDGDPLEMPDYDPATFPPLHDRALQLGLTIRYGAAPGARFRGYYRPSDKHIALMTHDVRTFFHELAHAAHHTFAAQDTNPSSKTYAHQEIVAETVAATLCQLYGYEGFHAHSAEYIRHYDAEHGNPGRAAMKVLADVQKCLNVILDTAPASAGAVQAAA